MKEDTLSLAASGVSYFCSDGRAAPDNLVIRWAVCAHHCDGVPYVCGVDSPADVNLPSATVRLVGEAVTTEVPGYRSAWVVRRRDHCCPTIP
jgi:hypothetical protein